MSIPKICNGQDKSRPHRLSASAVSAVLIVLILLIVLLAVLILLVILLIVLTAVLIILVLIILVRHFVSLLLKWMFDFVRHCLPRGYFVQSVEIYARMN